MNKRLKVIIIAGPNGAGKTTFAREFLPNEANCPIFINADLIAAGLSPFRPEAAAVRAGRLMIEEMAAHVAARRRFAAGQENPERIYKPLVNTWIVYDNSGIRPNIIEWSER